MCKMYIFHVTRCVNGAELGHGHMTSLWYSKRKPCALVAEHVKNRCKCNR